MDREKRRRELKCIVHPLDTLGEYKYVVVCSLYQGHWLLSRHKMRDTWETQGGHIETNETSMDTARRELYEESGITDADIYPVCDYYGYDGEWEHRPARTSDVRKLCADSQRARKLLGFTPQVDFAEGIRLTLDWYRENGEDLFRKEGQV